MIDKRDAIGNLYCSDIGICKGFFGDFRYKNTLCKINIRNTAVFKYRSTKGSDRSGKINTCKLTCSLKGGLLNYGYTGILFKYKRSNRSITKSRTTNEFYTIGNGDGFQI